MLDRHKGYAEDQIEALVVVLEEQIGAQVIETPVWKVGASGSDRVFVSVEPDESGLGRIEARCPAAHAGAHFQNVERYIGAAFLSRSNEPRLECRGLHAVRDLTGAQAVGLCFEQGASLRGYIAWVITRDRKTLALGPTEFPAHLRPKKIKGTLRK